MEDYNRYRESLNIDCCSKDSKTKNVKSSSGCCGGENLPSHSNELEVLVRQLKREVKKLLNTTEAKLLCQDKKIAETMVYIKNNLGNALRNLLDSMITSGEMEEIIKDIITGNVNALVDRITDLEIEYITVNNNITSINNNLQLIGNELTRLNKLKSKMVVIGDSWSIENYPYISDINNMWQHLVSKQLGLELKNYAVSGAGFTVSENLFETQVTRAIADNSNPKEVKYIFVFGGINDLDNGTPSDLKTACDDLIEQIKAYFTDSQIILCGCNTQVKFKTGENNPTYNNIDITNVLQQSAYENGITFIDTQPFLYGITNTINEYEHPSLEGLKALSNGILSCLNSTYTRVASSNANASYTLSSEQVGAPSFIVQSSVKNNTLKLLFFISGITSSVSTQNYLYNFPEINLPYMNAEPLKNLDTGVQGGAIKVTSDNSKLVRIAINSGYSGSLYFETKIEI